MSTISFDIKQTPMSAKKIAAMRREINDFISNYRASFSLIESGLRHGVVTPITDRNKTPIVPAEKIIAYCNFIREYGLKAPTTPAASIDHYPTVRSFVIMSEPLSKN